MNKTRIVLYATTAVVAAMCILFAACSNDEVIKTNDNINEPTAQIQLSASMEATLTRAANNIQSTALDNASAPAVYIYRTGQTANDDNYGFANIAVTKSSSTYTEPTLFYPQNKGNIDVYMYAPKQDTNPSLTAMPITVATDQSDKTNYLASDFVHGLNKGTYTESSYVGIPYNNGGNGAIAVNLVHDLSKIILDIQPGTGGATIDAASVKSVTLGDGDICLQATVDITSGTWDATSSKIKPTANATTNNSGTKGTITFADATTAQQTVAAIIPPQTVTNAKLVVKINDTDYEATLSSPDGGFLAGKQYTYTVKVNLQSLEISVTEIENWSAETGGNINVQ